MLWYDFVLLIIGALVMEELKKRIETQFIDGDYIIKISVLEMKKVKGIIYLAVQKLTVNKHDPFDKQNEVNVNVYVNDEIIEECDDPPYYNCPRKIMSILTKAKTDGSKNWRKKVNGILNGPKQSRG